KIKIERRRSERGRAAQLSLDATLPSVCVGRHHDIATSHCVCADRRLLTGDGVLLVLCGHACTYIAAGIRDVASMKPPTKQQKPSFRVWAARPNYRKPQHG